MRRSGWRPIEESLAQAALLSAPARRVLAGPGPEQPDGSVADMARGGAIVLTLGDVADGGDDALETAAAFLERGDGDLCMLFYASPGDALAHALAEDEDIEAALGDWLDDARRMVGFIETFPARTILIHVGAALADPDGLAAHLAVRMPGSRLPVRLKAPEPDVRSLLSREAGRGMAARLPQASALLRTLDASAVLDSRQPRDLDAETCRRALAALDSDVGRSGELARMMEEQGARMEELEAALAAESRRRRGDLEALEALRVQTEEREARRKAELLAAGRALSAEREARRQAEDAAARLKASVSWKLTAPLRAVWGMFRPRLARRSILRDRVQKVRASAFFDADWYLRQYPDVAAAGVDPAEHYVRSGAKEGRAPGPDFCSVAYLADHPDVAAAGINPLVHHIESGAAEGRRVRPARF